MEREKKAGKEGKRSTFMKYIASINVQRNVFNRRDDTSTDNLTGIFNYTRNILECKILTPRWQPKLGHTRFVSQRRSDLDFRIRRNDR